MHNTDTMAFVFFVYGLSFFTLGLAIFIYPKRNSVFSLAPDLNLIAAFGLSHGINEWLDLFILINTSGSTQTLACIRAVILPMSFLFLVAFGIKAMTQAHPTQRHWVVTLPLALVVAWALLVVLSRDRLTMGDICARYLIGLPGALLCAHGLHLHLRQLRKTRLIAVIKHLRFMIVVFFIYGLLAGVFVKRASFPPASFLNYETFIHVTGVPIQIFRAAAAALLAYATLRVLRIFHWETQTRLEEGDLRVHTLAAAAPMILFQHDKHGMLRHIEGRNLNALPLDPGRLIGQPVSTLFPGLDTAGLVHKAWAPGEVHYDQVTAADRVYYLCYTPSHSGDGSISGFVGAALDITQQLASQTEIETYRRELSQTRQLTELGTMSKFMAEKLWQPLQVVKLQLQRLLVDDGSLNDPQRVTRILEQSLRGIEEATAQVQRLRDRVQVLPAKPSTTIAMESLLKRLAAVHVDQARSVHTEIVIQAPATLPMPVIAERELEYVATAFIECALEHGPVDTPSHLIVRAEVEDTDLLMSFIDTHRVLNAEEQERMFVPFPETVAHGQGCGLSMAVVHEIVQTHGGHIRIDSQAGQGTTLAVQLPLQT